MDKMVLTEKQAYVEALKKEPMADAEVRGNAVYVYRTSSPNDKQQFRKLMKIYYYNEQGQKIGKKTPASKFKDLDNKYPETKKEQTPIIKKESFVILTPDGKQIKSDNFEWAKQKAKEVNGAVISSRASKKTSDRLQRKVEYQTQRRKTSLAKSKAELLSDSATRLYNEGKENTEQFKEIIGEGNKLGATFTFGDRNAQEKIERTKKEQLETYTKKLNLKTETYAEDRITGQTRSLTSQEKQNLNKNKISSIGNEDNNYKAITFYNKEPFKESKEIGSVAFSQLAKPIKKEVPIKELNIIQKNKGFSKKIVKYIASPLVGFTKTIRNAYEPIGNQFSILTKGKDKEIEGFKQTPLVKSLYPILSGIEKETRVNSTYIIKDRDVQSYALTGLLWELKLPKIKLSKSTKPNLWAVKSTIGKIKPNPATKFIITQDTKNLIRTSTGGIRNIEPFPAITKTNTGRIQVGVIGTTEKVNPLFKTFKITKKPTGFDVPTRLPKQTEKIQTLLKPTGNYIYEVEEGLTRKIIKPERQTQLIKNNYNPYTKIKSEQLIKPERKFYEVAKEQIKDKLQYSFNNKYNPISENTKKLIQSKILTQRQKDTIPLQTVLDFKGIPTQEINFKLTVKPSRLGFLRGKKAQASLSLPKSELNTNYKSIINPSGSTFKPTSNNFPIIETSQSTQGFKGIIPIFSFSSTPKQSLNPSVDNIDKIEQTSFISTKTIPSTITDTNIEQNIFQNSALKQNIGLVFESELITGQGLKTNTIQEIKQTQLPKQELKQTQLPKQELKSKLIIGQYNLNINKQLTPTNEITQFNYITPQKPTTQEPPTKFIYFKPSKKKKKKEFNVFVKAFGKDKKIGTFKSESLAKSFLRSKLKTTARASGFIKSNGLKEYSDLGKGFRRSKKDSFRTVQKRSTRISSSGELREITYKGLRLKKTKRWFK